MPNPFNIPGAPAALIAKINARRATIPAGLMMMADGDEAAKPEASDAGDTKPDTDPKGDDEQLGEGGKRALQAEREARRSLEDQVKQLAPLKGQMEAIAAAFGVKPSPNTDLASQVAELQQQVATMTAKRDHDSLVASVVANHDSLSAADVALVAELSEREAMEKLAARLAEGAKPGIPRPDPSVGKGGESKADGGSVSAGRDLFRERHQKKNS